MESMSELYDLTLSKEAEDDFLAYVDYIIYTCDAPKTGKKHTEDLRDILRKIQKNPTASTIRTSASCLSHVLKSKKYTAINQPVIKYFSQKWVSRAKKA